MGLSRTLRRRRLDRDVLEDPADVAEGVVMACTLFGRDYDAIPDVCDSIVETVDECPMTAEALFATIERAGPAARVRDYTLSDLLETARAGSRAVGAPMLPVLPQFVLEEIKDAR